MTISAGDPATLRSCALLGSLSQDQHPAIKE
jgi:hypothetical protein